MTKLQRRYNSHDQLIRYDKLDLPLLNPLNMPRLSDKRLAAVQWPKLARAKHLPGTVVIVTDPPATGSEHSAFDHLDMAVGNEESELVHRPQFTRV